MLGLCKNNKHPASVDSAATTHLPRRHYVEHPAHSGKEQGKGMSGDSDRGAVLGRGARPPWGIRSPVLVMWGEYEEAGWFSMGVLGRTGEGLEQRRCAGLLQAGVAMRVCTEGRRGGRVQGWTPWNREATPWKTSTSTHHQS
jgi:hypothetical protein